MVITLTVTSAAAASTPPTQLWYRMHVTYSARFHSWLTRPVPETQHCCYWITTGAYHDEYVNWEYRTDGSMLVRNRGRITYRLQNGTLLDGYSWRVLHGKATGELTRAEVDDRTTFEAQGFAAGEDPHGTPTTGHCSYLARGDLELGATHFENGAIYLATGVIDPYLGAVPVEERIRKTYEYSGCERISTLTPPLGPVPDETEQYRLPLPWDPTFDRKALFAGTTSSLLFALRGRNRFGGRHVILRLAASYHHSPTVVSTEPEVIVEDSARRDAKVTFDRCPGTAPC